MEQGRAHHVINRGTSPSERAPVVLVLGKPRPEPLGEAVASGRDGAPSREVDHGLPLDLGTLLASASGEPAVVAGLLAAFAAGYPGRRTVLQDAVSRDDAGALTRTAHELEAHLRALGATAAAALTRQLTAPADRRAAPAGELLANLDREVEALLGLAGDTDRLTAALIRASA
jgi:HPt (histidine-containing phosphotransfer) domain-containing protein